MDKMEWYFLQTQDHQPLLWLRYIDTKCAPTYACIFMDKMEWYFLQTQDHQPLLWLRYIDDIFFICAHVEKILQTFLEKLNKFHHNVKFTHESSKENISFLDLNLKLSEGQLETV